MREGWARVAAVGVWEPPPPNHKLLGVGRVRIRRMGDFQMARGEGNAVRAFRQEVVPLSKCTANAIKGMELNGTEKVWPLAVRDLLLSAPRRRSVP